MPQAPKNSPDQGPRSISTAALVAGPGVVPLCPPEPITAKRGTVSAGARR